MRTAGSAILVILALLLGAVAGPSLWLQRHVVDQEGFVALASPLGNDKEFQESLTILVSSKAVASLELPPLLNDLAVQVVNAAARNLYTDPAYQQAWSQTLQRSHALNFAGAANADAASELKLDIAPLVELVAAKVAADVGVTVPTSAEIVVVTDQPEIARVLPVAATLGSWSGGMVFIAGGLLVVGVIIARRRSLTVLAAGVGLALVALVWLLASGAAESYLSALAIGEQPATELGSRLAALAKDSWEGGITATFVGGAALAAAGVAALIVTRRHTT